MQGKLVICDRDLSYAEKLRVCLERDRKLKASAAVCREETEAETLLQEDPSAVLLLSRSSETDSLRKFMKNGRGIYLTDVRGYEKIEGIPAVYKYQTAAAICQEIENREKERSQPENRTEKVFYTGVMNADAGNMRTSFSLTLGQLLAEKRKTLYLCFDPCPLFSERLGCSFSKTFPDYLYAYRNAGKTCELQGYSAEYHGLCLIPPSEDPGDLLEADPELVCGAAVHFAEAGGFEQVILDPGSDFRLMKALIPLCKKIIVPTLPDVWSLKKTAAFTGWLRKEAEGKWEETVLPPVRTSLCGKEYTEHLIWSELGETVRALLQDERQKGGNGYL